MKVCLHSCSSCTTRTWRCTAFVWNERKYSPSDRI